MIAVETVIPQHEPQRHPGGDVVERRVDHAVGMGHPTSRQLDLGSVEPCIAGPKRPQDRIALSAAAKTYRKHLEAAIADRKAGGSAAANIDGKEVQNRDGAILIAAITSCTNTSNPAVMLAAGLVAKKARELYWEWAHS